MFVFAVDSPFRQLRRAAPTNPVLTKRRAHHCARAVAHEAITGKMFWQFVVALGSATRPLIPKLQKKRPVSRAAMFPST
jgi:hypothetical protein